MKSSAPWSVKGVERDARETAKEAARREGMTVGEWLNQVIYTASDPASSNGQIEGLKISDLVSAIEHVSKRVISAEKRDGEAFEEVSRNLSVVVERLQRLERQRPAEGEVSGDFEERLRRVEERTGDRSRIDALRALERAVGQVAAQFDSSQKAVAGRLDSLERHIQQVAGRIDAARADASAADAIDHLKNMVDATAARVARIERSAAEAARQPRPVEPQGDPEFVEQTGAKLRVLGDEIKRGGDQIRGLESAIKKLALQIDAAERRSSEGVQKVAETISDLRAQVSEADSQKSVDPRAEIEAAISESAQRTEDRINQLQRSFEAILDKLESAKLASSKPGLAAAPAAPVVEVRQPAAPAQFFSKADAPAAIASKPAAAPTARQASDGAGFEDETVEDAEAANRAEIEAALSAFDLDFSDAAPATLDEGQGGEESDAFDLSDEEADAQGAESGRSGPDPAGILADVKAAFEDGAPAKKSLAAGDREDSAASDDIDSILAELEGFGESAPQDDATPPKSVAAQKPAAANYLQEARRAAKEAAEKAAAETADATGKRKLTPKQRAILAAKIRRKRLAAEQQAAAEASEPPIEKMVSPAADPRAGELPEDRTGSPSLIGGALAAFQKFKSRQSQAVDAAEDLDGVEKVRGASASKKPRPVTLALGAAVVLAIGAVAFPLKDLVFGSKPKSAEKPAAPRPTPSAEPIQTAPEAAAPEVPSPPVVKPRALYLDSVAKLKAAKSDSDTREALKGLQEAAALGHPPAQLQLGELYKLGQGVEQDGVQARAWYERAANGGNVLAMHRIGVMSARGQGGPVDQQAAIRWFETAGNLGLVDSQYNLGAIYHPGGDSASGVQDAAKAYFWYSLAAKNGDTQAGELAAGLGAGLTAAKKKEVDAEVASWKAGTPDPDANEVAPAS